MNAKRGDFEPARLKCRWRERGSKDPVTPNDHCKHGAVVQNRPFPTAIALAIGMQARDVCCLPGLQKLHDALAAKPKSSRTSFKSADPTRRMRHADLGAGILGLHASVKKASKRGKRLSARHVTNWPKAGPPSAPALKPRKAGPRAGAAHIMADINGLALCHRHRTKFGITGRPSTLGHIVPSGAFWKTVAGSLFKIANDTLAFAGLLARVPLGELILPENEPDRRSCQAR